MTVYVDNMKAKFGRMIMCHMLADTEEELEEMALKIGVQLKWWQFKGTRKSHFDISLGMKKKAIQLGAVEVSVHELGFMLKDRKKCGDPLGKPREIISKN